MVCGLSNDNTFNDLEGPLTHVSRLRYYSLNISEMAKDTATIAIHSLLRHRPTRQQKHKTVRTQIGNRTQAFKWYHFQWPWVTFWRSFQGHLIFFDRE